MPIWQACQRRQDALFASGAVGRPFACARLTFPALPPVRHTNNLAARVWPPIGPRSFIMAPIDRRRGRAASMRLAILGPRGCHLCVSAAGRWRERPTRQDARRPTMRAGLAAHATRFIWPPLWPVAREFVFTRAPLARRHGDTEPPAPAPLRRARTKKFAARGRAANGALAPRPLGNFKVGPLHGANAGYLRPIVCVGKVVSGRREQRPPIGEFARRRHCTGRPNHRPEILDSGHWTHWPNEEAQLASLFVCDAPSQFVAR